MLRSDKSSASVHPQDNVSAALPKSVEKTLMSVSQGSTAERSDSAPDSAFTTPQRSLLSKTPEKRGSAARKPSRGLCYLQEDRCHESSRENNNTAHSISFCSPLPGQNGSSIAGRKDVAIDGP
jgi:hypothetical protein